jgi:hypothetical protein
LVTAPGIDVHGSAVHATSDFAAESPDVVAVVEVGGLPGRSAPLTVSWYQTQANRTERLLFTHRLDVAPGDHAYSVGASTGRLALGLYRVEASLSGKRLEAPFMVYEPLDVMVPSSGTPGSGAAATPTTSVVPVQPNLSLPASESGGVMLTADNSGPPVGDGGPPVSGPNGVIPPPSPAPASAGGCQLAITGDVSLAVLVDVTSCNGDAIEVSGDVDGHTKVLGTLNAADATIPVGGNPCSVDPNLGFDPVPITYTAKVVRGPDLGKSATLSGVSTGQAASAPPKLILSRANPEQSSQVAAGQAILMVFQAESDSGIESLKVTRDPGGVVVADQRFGQGAAPTRCKPDRNFQYVAATDTVPDNPAPILTYTAVVQDFAGRSQSLTIEYPTEAVWVGRAFGPGLHVTPPLHCDTNWNVQPIEVAVSQKNDLSGSAIASTPGLVGCPRADENGLNKGTVSFQVGGTYDGTTFRLHFQVTGFTGAPGNGSISVLYQPTLLTVVVTRTSDKQATGTIDVIGACPGVTAADCSWHLTMEIWLTCCGPYAGPIAPPAPILKPPIYLQ